MITDYKLFIYEELDNSIRKYYWMQINNDKGWKPITDELYNDLLDEGWIEDLEYVYDDVNKEDIVFKELELIDEDRIGLMNFDDDILNDFNELDIEIKNGQKYPFNMIDMIDYNNGKVYILKYNEK
jgi:archaellum component FlaC